MIAAAPMVRDPNENTRQYAIRMAKSGPKGSDPKTISLNATRGKHRQFYEGEARRKEFLECIAAGMLVKAAVAKVGVRYDTYERWRSRFPSFAAQVDSLRNGTRNPGPADPDQPRQLNRAYDVAEDRKRWFGHDTPPFQMEMIDGLMQTPPGHILMVLLPPEFGKTTCYEDFKTLDIAYNPWTLSHVGSESIALSKKILTKIRGRLDPAPGNHRMVEFFNRFGPFAPQKGERKTQQPWSTTHFDVWRKGDFDDRDYTMAALGFGSQIIGSRSNHLHCDDLQSLKTLSLTEKYLSEFRQDWWSRPGVRGITSIFGNRVDDGDVYGAIEEAFGPDILHIVRYPAIVVRDGVAQSLWPERWSMEQLDIAQKVTEPGGWERNWMQNPRSKAFLAFTDEMLQRCYRPELSLRRPKPEDGKICYVSLDPAIGGRTAITVWQVTHAGRMRLVYLRDIPGLRSNEEIMSYVAAAIAWTKGHGLRVTNLIIEAKNFQAGLCRDERLLTLANTEGISVGEHLTGWNKYDENIGVSSMVTTFVKQELELPWADDPETRVVIAEYVKQFTKWRPSKGGGGQASAMGNKLRQDLVMSTWFAWIRWRQIGKVEDETRGSASQFSREGLPYAPTGTGLIVPTKYSPTLVGAGSRA